MTKRTIIVDLDEEDRRVFHKAFQEVLCDSDPARTPDWMRFDRAHRSGVEAIPPSYRRWLLANRLTANVYCKARVEGCGTSSSGRLKFVFSTSHQAAKAKLLLCGRNFLARF